MLSASGQQQSVDEGRPVNPLVELLAETRVLADRAIKVESAEASRDGERYALCSDCLRGARGVDVIEHAPSCVVGRVRFLLDRVTAMVRETAAALDVDRELVERRLAQDVVRSGCSAVNPIRPWMGMDRWEAARWESDRVSDVVLDKPAHLVDVLA